MFVQLPLKKNMRKDSPKIAIGHLKKFLSLSEGFKIGLSLIERRCLAALLFTYTPPELTEKAPDPKGDYGST